jgi:adenylate cyclase
LAVLLPSLALLGVLQGGRQVEELARNDPAWPLGVLSGGHLADRALAAELDRNEADLFVAYFASLALVLAALHRPHVEGRRRFSRVRPHA